MTIIHIALDIDGTVLAHFAREADCTSFCESGVKYTHLRFNTSNRYRTAPPAVGTVYRA